MFNMIRSRRLLPLAALALATLLGGCYYGPYPGYGYNGGGYYGGGGYYAGGYYGAPYYSGATVAIGGGGWGWRGHDHDHDHDDHGSHGGDWHR
jgi:hypothetical protein